VKQLITMLQKNKTTVAGVAAIVGIVAKIAATGHVDLNEIVAVLTGVGLIHAQDAQ
jgi:hypothetical protein